MSFFSRFRDITARKPMGKLGVMMYSDPKGHYKSFKLIMDKLKLSKNDTYCEIGCGGGMLLKTALESAKSASAIDHSCDMVELAVKNNENAVNAKRAFISVGNAENLPWKTGTFSACGCANMFFFVENPYEVLGEIYRVLKPGGRFAMVTMGKGFAGKIVWGFLYGLRTYTDYKMKEMMIDSGFKIAEVSSGFMKMTQVCYGEK